jgi:2-polyprenyl-6-methoxyphenol hydroxylase-like FAD-dependent oxidoreductase
MQKANILIIGAGIGGLTAAFAPGRRGFRVDMIERDPDWRA